VRPHVTVVVPVKDRRERMLRCLDGVLAQDHPSFEVLVLDNGSTDGTPEACLRRGAATPIDVRVERVDGRIGRVRNAGTRLARGEVLAFTDSDCIPTPGWLTAAARPFDDPTVGIVTGPTLPEDPMPLGAWAATQHITEQTWRFETCNALFRRQALLTSDGFDETVTMWEDTAAGWAVMRHGWRAVFAPDAIVHHDVTYPGWRWHVRRVMRYGDGAGVVRRYPEMADTLLWHRIFFRQRNAKVAAAVAAVLLAPITRIALLLALPYLWFRRPVRLRPRAFLESAQLTVFDLSILVGMIRGSVRGRRLLL
jgi:cellulose synthase/poly-beta-1,6-N-acetylglucosamine synthase-like glycosyltransferase